VTANRLSAEQVEARLEQILFATSSIRSIEKLGDSLARLPRERQDFLLHWAEVAAHSNVELAYQVISRGPEALDRIGQTEAERWILSALDTYDRRGLQAGIGRFRTLEGFGDLSERRGVVHFEEIDRRLGLFLHGLSGRALRLERADVAYTDTVCVFLPGELTRYARAEQNRGLYRAMAAMLWAQNRFGTFADRLGEWRIEDGNDHALAWLGWLEALRLEACIERELPALARELIELRGELPAPLAACRASLERPGATVGDALDLLARMDTAAPPPVLPYATVLRPEEALRARAERLAAEIAVLRRSLTDLLARHRSEHAEPPELTANIDRESLSVEIRVNGEAMPLPVEVRRAAASVVQDLGELPVEMLAPAGPADWHPTDALAAESGTEPVEGSLSYDEWDYRRGAYRKDWCRLTEEEVPAGSAAYAEEVRLRYAPLIAQIKRRFELLRGEDRTFKRQSEGEEVDLDAVVEAFGDRAAGIEPNQRFFCRRRRSERSLAALFMVDMSGSTKGWVNDAEREALLMLCEALEKLGDRYAIYGFSGWTRTRCQVYRIKRFGDRYDETVRRRIAGVQAKDYTRMGAPIRHLSGLLAREPVKHRLLITLSDGKPDDFSDDYRSQYGIEDTRRALLEARQAGIRAFCITIDRHGPDYLRHMYGPARYVVIDDVRKLPHKVSDVYRRLAS
jgi:nitric oxide reductase NorD protein